jgi:hypothetical protein
MPHVPTWTRPEMPRWMPRPVPRAPELRAPALPGWMPLGVEPLIRPVEPIEEPSLREVPAAQPEPELAPPTVAKAPRPRRPKPPSRSRRSTTKARPSAGPPALLVERDADPVVELDSPPQSVLEPEPEPTPEPKTESSRRPSRVRQAKPKRRQVPNRPARAQRLPKPVTPPAPAIEEVAEPAAQNVDPYAELAKHEADVVDPLADAQWGEPAEESVPRKRRFSIRSRSKRHDESQQSDVETPELLAESHLEEPVGSIPAPQAQPEPAAMREPEPTPAPRSRLPKVRPVQAKRPRARTRPLPIVEEAPEPAPQGADLYAELARPDPETNGGDPLADARWGEPTEELVPRKRRFSIRSRSKRHDESQQSDVETPELLAEPDLELLEPAPVLEPQAEPEPFPGREPRASRRGRSSRPPRAKAKSPPAKRRKTTVEPDPEEPVVRYEPFPDVFPVPAPDAADLYAELRPEWQTEEPESEPAALSAFDAQGAKAKPESANGHQCSRCHQPSERPVCDACAEALDLLRALSTPD